MFRQKTFFRYFPAPRFLEMPCVGIDISTMTMRFIETHYNKTFFKVGKFAEENLTTPFSLSEGNHEEVKTILKKWKKEFHLEYIEASIPEEKAYLFKTTIEFTDDESMRNTIELSLEENVPLAGNECIFDYIIIDDKLSEESNHVNVVVTVLPRQVVESYIALFRECDLVPLSFLIEAQAISKALIKKDDPNVYFIVNISDTRTGLFVVNHGSVQFTSTLSIGSNDFTAALMKQFSITAPEAEELKKTKGFTRSTDNEGVLSALISTASVFREEIEKVFIYWHTLKDKKGNSEVPINKIVLCGKDSLILGFKEYLSQNIKVTTEVGNVWTNVATFDEYIPPIAQAEALNFAAAIGLSLPKID